MISKVCEEYGTRPTVWRTDANTGVTLTFFAPEVTTEIGMGVITEVKAVLTALTGDMTCCELQEKLGLKNS
jgi:ATP-dependent DNA helicase RecG